MTKKEKAKIGKWKPLRTFLVQSKSGFFEATEYEHQKFKKSAKCWLDQDYNDICTFSKNGTKDLEDLGFVVVMEKAPLL